MSRRVQVLLDHIGQPEQVFLLLDYDGTVVPIAPTPDLAHPTPDVLELLRRLGSIDTVRLAIISGRSLDDLERLLPLETIFLVGNHGAEIRTPAGDRLHLVDPQTIQTIMSQLAAELKLAVAGLAGCIVENKGISLALHYRLASASAAQQAIAHFTRLSEPLVTRGEFEWLQGKKIVEVRPVGVNKGQAVRFLLDRYSSPGQLPIYMGDDLTDEDAFRALDDVGISILISAVDRPSAAKYRLESPADAGDFLTALIRRSDSKLSP
jgi:trehalose 6-phosphate phosphatase